MVQQATIGKLLNDGPKWIVLIVWTLINIGLFVGYFFHYYDSDQYFYLRVITGPCLAIARASAAAINFDCLLILLPVCRNLLSFVRGSMKQCCKRNVRRQLDKNITFHKVCAYMICLLTVVHYVAHCYNLEYFVEAHDSPNNATRGLLSALTQIPGNTDGVWLNPVRSPSTNPMIEALKTWAGVTGVAITLALIVMVSSATDTIRHSYFEIFWYTHHLFVVFFIGLVLHGIQGLVRSQVNVDEHDPHVCQYKYKEWGEIDECPVPVFQAGKAKTWYWVIGPMFLYMVERCIRFYRSQQKVVISKVVMHPSRVVELQMKKRGFSHEPGEYIFLHCPSISKLEWHPFTLTSCNQEGFFSVHVRIVGDWTTELSKAMKADQGEFQEAWTLPSIAVDGPFGTASEDIFQYQTDVLVAAGIGVTPFASVLKDIWFKTQDPNYNMKLQKVYFYWMCPDLHSFEWFADVLKHMERRLDEANRPDFLSINIFVTRGWDSKQANKIAVNEEEVYDLVTGLREKTNFGRPNWEAEFAKISAAHKGTSVGVFFCGPKALSNVLHKKCNEHSPTDTRDESKARFFYNKENF